MRKSPPPPLWPCVVFSLAGALLPQAAWAEERDFEADAGISSGVPDRSPALGLAWQFH